MQPRPLHSPVRPDPLWEGPRLLFALMVTAGLTLAGIGVIAIICKDVVAPIAHGPKFDAQFTIEDGLFYADQSKKTASYQTSILATPFLIAFSFGAARLLGKNLSDELVKLLNQIGIGLYLLLLVLCAWPIVYCPHPPLPLIPPSWLILPFNYSHPFYTPSRILLLVAAGGLGCAFLKSHASRRNGRLVMLLLLAAWSSVIPSRFYVPNDMGDDYRYLYHLNSVLDSLSQSINGHHLLVDFPHIYGGYGEMLAPIVRLFPRSIGVLIAAMAVPNVVGMLCLLLTARLVIRQPSVLFVTGLALLGVCCLTSSEDINYGYLTAREGFPPLGILAAVLYFRRPTTFRYAAATTIAAMATIWNLDTGVVLWVSWLVTLMAMAVGSRSLPGVIGHFLRQFISLALTWALFFLYLRLAEGQWPNVGLLFYFQRLVIDSGYFCLPLIFPDMWVFIVTVYVIGLTVVFISEVRGKTNWLTRAMLFLSMFGIGIFSYFMGRSAESNLVFVAYPAVLLAGIFCAEGDILMRLKWLPASARFFLLPSRIALFWWAFLMVAALPDLYTKSEYVASNWMWVKMTPLRQKIAFVRESTWPNEDGVYFLSNHSGIYYYMSRTTRPLKIPGTIELLRASDMDTLIDAIRNRQIAKLFVEPNFYETAMYRPDVYQKLRDTIDVNYLEASAGPTGRLMLFEPRQ